MPVDYFSFLVKLFSWITRKHGKLRIVTFKYVYNELQEKDKKTGWLISHRFEKLEKKHIK